MLHFRESTAHDSPLRPKQSPRLVANTTVPREHIQFWFMLRAVATPLVPPPVDRAPQDAWYFDTATRIHTRCARPRREIT